MQFMSNSPTSATALSDIPEIDPRYNKRIENLSADQLKLRMFNVSHQPKVITP